MNAEKSGCDGADRALGAQGEHIAQKYLEGLGMTLVGRNYAVRGAGEIDLIMRDGETLVFVEVKTRRNALFGDGAEAVERRKQMRLKKTAQRYIIENASDAFCRFDVVELYVGVKSDVYYYKNAFE